MCWHVGRIGSLNVETFSNSCKMMNGECGISMDFEDHEWSLLSWNKFVLTNVFTDDINILSNIVVMRMRVLFLQALS